MSRLDGDHKAVIILGFIAAITISIAIGVGGYYSVRTAEIQQEADAIAEHEATERTEERAQFWQKLIPWGSDEAEADDVAE